MTQRSRHLTTDRLRTLALGAGMMLFLACGGDSSNSGGTTGPTPTPVQTTPVGSYDISTVNAKSLPVAIFSDTNYKYEVMNGSIALTTDGKYVAKITWRQTVAGKVDLFPDSTFGTWVLSGTTVQFTNGQDKSTDKADWSNTGSLTFVETEGTGTNTYVYVKK